MKKLFIILLSAATLAVNAQTVVTYAGKSNNDPYTNYESGQGVALDNTFFSLPRGICFDNNGKMYISEVNKVRAVINNKLYIRAGSLQQPSFSEGYKNGTGTQATFRNPEGMVASSNGDIYLADVDNHCIRKISAYTMLGTGQSVSTFAGANPTTGLPGYGTPGSSNGTGTAARFNKPTDICVDNAGNFYVTEYGNYTVRKITPSGVVTTLAGSAGVEGTTDATGSAARFGGPWGIAMYNENNIVVTDPWNCNIRMINTVTGVVTTLAGPTTGPSPGQVDGTLTQARFKKPKGIAVVNGIIYVADENLIRAIDVDGNSVTTFAGSKGSYSITDGEGSSAAFTELSALTTDGLGNLYASEASSAVASSVIRKITINDLAPAAKFSVDKANIIINEVATLTDNSTGEEASDRDWTISPTNYAVKSGSLKDKVLGVSFNQEGFYEVSLSITNSFGTDTKTEPSYIVVSTTGSVTSYAQSNIVKVYPNPANATVNILLDPSFTLAETSVFLYHINGQKIKDIDPSSTISIADLPNGTYFVTISTNDIRIAKKLIVSHR